MKIGIAVSGKLCSGKETFLQIMKKHNSSIVGLAFADKLKLFAKYLLVKLSNEPETAVHDVSVLVRKQLFGNEVPLSVVQEKLQTLADAPHTKEFAKPGISLFGSDRFPEQDFGFNNIDSLWADCGKPRRMLQELGTECMRSIRDTVWVDYAFSIIARYPQYRYCITDTRFPNEVEYSKARGLLDVRLVASDEIRRQRGLARDGQDYSAMFQHPSETALDDYPFTVVLKNEGTPEKLESLMMKTPAITAMMKQTTEAFV